MNERIPGTDPLTRGEPGGNGAGAPPGMGAANANGAAAPPGLTGNHSAGAYPVLSGPLRDEPEGMGFQDMVALLWRRRWLILATFLAVVGAGVLTTMLTRPIYQATSTLLINIAGRPMPSSDQASVLADLGGMTQVRNLETQMEVLRGSPIRTGALQRLTPAAKQAILEYADVNVIPVTGTDILSISVLSHNASAAAAYADAMCAEYQSRNLADNRSQIHNASQYVEKKLREIKPRLDAAQTALKNYKVRNGTVNVAAESGARIAELGAAQASLRAATVEHAASVARLGQLKADVAGMAPVQIVPGSIVRSPEVLALKAQLTKLYLDRLSAMQEYNPHSPEVTSIEGQIAAIQSRVRVMSQTEVSSWQRTVNPVRQALAQQIATTQSEVLAQEARSAVLRGLEQQARAQLARLPEREFQVATLTNEVTAQQRAYDMLNEKEQSLRISEEARISDARIVSPATVPVTPLSPKKGRNILFAAALGLMLALALATLLDLSDDKIHSEEQVERATGRPVLAYVPFFTTLAHQSLLTDSRPNSPLLESYRMLRTNIAFSALEGPIRSMVLTSSQPNEGKSTCSVNLAVAMALDGKRVILVDCDLRRPSLHRILNLDNDIGFTNVVAGTQTLESALRPTAIANLQVLTSGPIPANPPELLNSQSGRACLQQIIERADLVIIDTPPALAIADAQIVAEIADATLLIISSQEAGQRETSRTTALLTQTGTRLLGAVLNKLETGYGGYGYYGYYRGYGKYYGTYIDASANPNTPTNQKVKR